MHGPGRSNGRCDDATGAVNTIQSDAIPLRLEAGISSSSGLDIVQYVYPDVAQDDALRVARLDGTLAYELAPDGSSAPATPSDLDEQVINPLNAMPDLGMFPSVIDAIAGGVTGALRIAGLAEQMANTNAQVVTLRAGVVVRRQDDNHILITIGQRSGSIAQHDGLEVSFERRRAGNRWVL